MCLPPVLSLGQILRWVAFLLIHLIHKSCAQTTDFDFSILSLTNLTLLGDAHLKNGTVSLSRELGVPTSSAGRALYNRPVRFLDPYTKVSASFKTRFSFSVTNVGPVPVSIGDGLAFVIAPDDHSLGSTGGYLGVMSPTGLNEPSPPPGNTIAVEFDTFLDVEFHDPNGNHIGLDINNMTSVAVADLGSINIDMKTGNLITAWIEYDNIAEILNVSMSYTNQKPSEPILSVETDLSSYLNEFMYVGFSASTGGSTEIHDVEWWSFSSFGPPSSNESPSKSPVYQPSSAFFSPLGTDEKPPVPSAPILVHKRGCHSHSCMHRGSIAGIATGGAVVVALATGLFVWFCYKRRGLKRTDTFSSDIVKLPRKFTYRELSNATKGFNAARVVGHGAFGTVYKGILPDDGALVAVKRSTCNNQGKNEFLAELSIIGRLSHRNLVHLQGWCHEKGEILLVYDYMSNSSLDKILFQEGGGPVLSWENRCKIVMGVASALAYLHGGWEKQVVHRDVKSSNIMLDGSFNARLGLELQALITATKNIDQRLEHFELLLEDGVRKTTTAVTNLDQRVEHNERLLEDVVRKIINEQTSNASIDCTYQAPVMPKCVGLDEPINVVRQYLLLNGVNRVDVRGMGGIGKTTLASALCNDPKIQDFFQKNIVFITVSESPNMMELLNIMWDKITKSTRPNFQSIEDARNQLQKFLSVKAPRPTLVVLNDVWSKLDLENLWFKAEGYKTMITTRYNFGILPTDGISVYDMNKLSVTDALELFCFSAFGCSFIPPSHDEELVKQVAAECDGLPLALNIIGSGLRGALPPDWKSAKVKLSRAESVDEFHRDAVLNCLKRSIDSLDDQLKECFLDLGAFPKGRKFSVDSLLDIWVYVRGIDRDIAFAVLLELARRNLLVLTRDSGNPAISYNCSPGLSLSQHDAAQCVRSSAISYGCSSELFFSQHDKMRDLAWNLARQDSKRIFMRGNEARHTKEYPNTRKDESSGFQFLSIQTGEMENRDWNRIDFDEVEALALFFTSSEYSVPEFIYSMRNLKFVMIYNYSSKRALLHWRKDSLPFTQIKSVLLERLIVPSLYEYCTAWESLEKFCVCLCEDSKKMTLSDKESLLKFPRIEEINIDHCSDLKELPGKICNLTDIKKLSVTNCHLLQELPDDLGKLRSLKLLRLSACLSLSKLPPSICDLGELKFLDISQCRGLKCFPSEFYQLSNLETLDMRGCEKLKKLPEGVTKLGSLKLIICDENTKRQWLSIKASAMPKLTVVVVEERFELDWLYN